MDFTNDSMQTDLIAIWRIQDSLRGAEATGGPELADRHMRELLRRTGEFVARYGPDSYTVGVGFPSGAAVSFTWQNKSKPVPRYLAEV